MKILILHCDYIRFKALKKAIKEPEEISATDKKGIEIKEPLVILTAIESGDSSNSIKPLVSNIKDVAKQVKAKNVVLYPYAHLSSNLAKPAVAKKLLADALKELKRQKLEAHRAPFGYYKEFELKVKGHPLSELSREIVVGKEGDVKKVEELYDIKQLLKSIGKTTLDRSKLKKNDHRIIGQEMNLFSFNDVAPGMVFWHNNGLIIYNEIIKFIREELKKENYEEVKTPEILDKKLWQISGHWEKYRDNIFLTKYENRDFAAKPMNCPGGALIYKLKPKSYKDLPLRVGEFGVVHRQELSGVLAGLFRVIEFTQDDAHVYCTEKQLESELLKLIKFVDKIYKKFKFKYDIELSTRPKKRIGSEKRWDKSEKILKKILNKSKKKFKINKGEGVFYGPKIDFHIKDSLARSWQCGTIQLDFSMPERFNLVYKDKDNKEKRPVMIHRAIFGSIERFIGILLEHTNGRLPTWLAPVQVKIISFTDRNKKATEKSVKDLKKAIPSLRIETDTRDTTVSAKVKEAELAKIPYIVMVGDKEEKNKTISIRHKGKVEYGIKIGDFTKKLKKELCGRE